MNPPDVFLRVAEIFYSLQGEGARQGVPSLFVRLQGCDLECGFCDTEFESGKLMSLPELYLALKQASPACEWIVWTGGEPTLQLTEEIVAWFKEQGFLQAIETNGNHPVPGGLDWVAVSPKVAEHVLARNFPGGVDELRYVRHSGQPGVPAPKIQAKRKFLSPLANGNELDKANVAHVLRLALENPEWNVSVQMHKMWRIL